MPSSRVPVAGSLSMKVIRACPTHRDCGLGCAERTVEDLGTVASFDTRSKPRRLGSWLRHAFLKERGA
jgi:hypothetical protein